MGFLFFTILLLPAILLYGLIVVSLGWAASHMTLVNTLVGILLALNLLFWGLLLRGRSRRRKNGQRKGLLSLFAVLWEGCVIALCTAFLIFQPLRYLPAGFGELFSLENNCYGVWTVTGCQGITPGCTQTQAEIDTFLGTQVAYSEECFTSTDWTYSLESSKCYQRDFVRQESFPPLYSMTTEALGIGQRNMHHVEITLSEWEMDDHPLGREFYVLDKNTLLLYRKGVFFRAERMDLPSLDRPIRPAPTMIRDPEAPPYYATWTVTELLGTTPENPMEQEIIGKILGTELRYQAGYILINRDDIGGISRKNTAYKETELTPEAFLSDYGISLEDLNVEPETYLAVTVDTDYGSLTEGLNIFTQSTGSQFLFLNDETILLCGKGAFFRAEIVPDSWPTIPDPDFQLPVPAF